MKVEEYIGVTLMPAIYNVYVSVLVERLRSKMEEKRVLSKNQMGFRKGMGTMNNIYIINYLVNRQEEG